jgi:hypothetical protein
LLSASPKPTTDLKTRTLEFGYSLAIVLAKESILIIMDIEILNSFDRSFEIKILKVGHKKAPCLGNGVFIRDCDYGLFLFVNCSMGKVDFIYRGQASYFTWKQMGEMRFITCEHPIFKSAFKGQDTVKWISLMELFEDKKRHDEEFFTAMQDAFKLTS